jgi:hypothetical protein
MQAQAEDPQITTLEKKLERGFAETRAQIASTEHALRREIASTGSELRGEIISVRTDARADFRSLLGVVVAMWVTTILAIVGVLLANL